MTRWFKCSMCCMACLFTAIVLLGVLSYRGVPAFSGGGGGALAGMNGDVNCDGKINISDAVFLIRYLFQAGEVPCALAGNAADLAQVVDGLREIKNQVAACCPRWPPRPEDMVSLTPENMRGSPIIFKVPQDKWLVITDVTADFVGHEGSFTLAEVVGEATVFKLTTSTRFGNEATKNYQFHSATGISFNPGSDLQMLADLLSNFTLTGYLTPAN